MRKYIPALTIALMTSSAFAINTCDTMPTKAKKEDCWTALIRSNMEEADEYAFKVEESRKVPAAVKRKVKEKRAAIASEANRLCKKVELGYPEDSCYLEQIQKFKDFTYEETSKYGVPDMRLN